MAWEFGLGFGSGRMNLLVVERPLFYFPCLFPRRTPVYILPRSNLRAGRFCAHVQSDHNDDSNVHFLLDSL
jgi:hypothetical protein